MRSVPPRGSGWAALRSIQVLREFLRRGHDFHFPRSYYEARNLRKDEGFSHGPPLPRGGTDLIERGLRGRHRPDRYRDVVLT